MSSEKNIIYSNVDKLEEKWIEWLHSEGLINSEKKIIYPNVKKAEEKWVEWLDTKGVGLFQLPLPPSALKDCHYFCDFVYDYADRFPIEPFSLDTLTDLQALQLLCILESYFFEYAFRLEGWDGDDRSCSRLYFDLRSRFNTVDNESLDCFPPFPKELLVLHGILDPGALVSVRK
jgi:hypothetical protein